MHLLFTFSKLLVTCKVRMKEPWLDNREFRRKTGMTPALVNCDTSHSSPVPQKVSIKDRGNDSRIHRQLALLWNKHTHTKWEKFNSCATSFWFSTGLQKSNELLNWNPDKAYFVLSTRCRYLITYVLCASLDDKNTLPMGQKQQGYWFQATTRNELEEQSAVVIPELEWTFFLLVLFDFKDRKTESALCNKWPKGPSCPFFF